MAKNKSVVWLVFGLLLQLLTNLHALRSLCISRGLIGDRVRTILTEELTGVISKHIRIGQNLLISTMLISQFLKKTNSLLELLIILNEVIFQVAAVLIQDGRSISTEVINNFKTCFAYPVCEELVPADFRRSLGITVGVSRVVHDPRLRDRLTQVVVLGNLRGTVIGRDGLLVLRRLLTQERELHW